jgi:IS5 family transposase
MREGTLVDATIIAAPPSTKNKEHARDPEMHQAKKGNQWHFGMKAHIGAGAEKRAEIHDLHVTWYVAMKRGKLKDWAAYCTSYGSWVSVWRGSR